ncbi:hypothetical protein ACFL23_04345 [Patescibacteria group bacterium]
MKKKKIMRKKCILQILNNCLYRKNAIKTVEADDKDFMQTAALDTLKNLGPISKEEVEYYKNL